MLTVQGWAALFGGGDCSIESVPHAGAGQWSAGSVGEHRRVGFRQVGVFSNVGRKFGQYWDVAWFERAMKP